MAGWTYNDATHVYHDEAGKRLSAAEMKTIRADFLESQKAIARGMAGQLSSGEINAATWELRMRGLAKETHIAQAVVGKGGWQNMTAADWGKVGGNLGKQYGFLGQFADATPDLSEAQIAARAEMYVDASNAAYSRTRTEELGATNLPAQPTEDCECNSRCRCFWQIEDGLATWISQQDAATCDTCDQRASDWVDLPVGEEVAA